MNWIDQIETRLAALEQATGIAKDVPQRELSIKEQLRNTMVYCETLDQKREAVRIYLGAGHQHKAKFQDGSWENHPVVSKAGTVLVCLDSEDGRLKLNHVISFWNSKLDKAISFPDFMAKFGPKQPETVTINVDGKDYVCRELEIGETLESADIFKGNTPIDCWNTENFGNTVDPSAKGHYFRPLALPKPKAEVFMPAPVLVVVYGKPIWLIQVKEGDILKGDIIQSDISYWYADNTVGTRIKDTIGLESAGGKILAIHRPIPATDLLEKDGKLWWKVPVGYKSQDGDYYIDREHLCRLPVEAISTLDNGHFPHYRPIADLPKEVDTKDKLLADMYDLLEMFCFSQSHPVGNAQRLNLIGRYNRLTKK